MLKEIVRERILLVNPTNEIKIPEAIHKERGYLTKEEVKKIDKITPPKRHIFKRFLNIFILTPYF